MAVYSLNYFSLQRCTCTLCAWSVRYVGLPDDWLEVNNTGGELLPRKEKKKNSLVTAKGGRILITICFWPSFSIWKNLLSEQSFNQRPWSVAVHQPTWLSFNIWKSLTRASFLTKGHYLWQSINQPYPRPGYFLRLNRHPNQLFSFKII